MAHIAAHASAIPPKNRHPAPARGLLWRTSMNRYPSGFVLVLFSFFAAACGSSTSETGKGSGGTSSGGKSTGGTSSGGTSSGGTSSGGAGGSTGGTAGTGGSTGCPTDISAAVGQPCSEEGKTC